MFEKLYSKSYKQGPPLISLSPFSIFLLSLSFSINENKIRVCFYRSKLLAAEEKVSEDKLTKLATDIEIKLFNLFNQVNAALSVP